MEASRLLKTISESFDTAQDERLGIGFHLTVFPFMLRCSKHSELSFCNLLG